MDRPTCSTCACWFETTVAGGKADRGQCRRHAPVVIHSGVPWPSTYSMNWCAEHSNWWRYTQWLMDQALAKKLATDEPCTPFVSSEGPGTTGSKP